MKGIITVVGRDRVGIIAEICTYLSARQVNILDISQTIRQEYFNMLMIVAFGEQTGFEEVARGLSELGGAMGMEIKLQREDIFESMHRV